MNKNILEQLARLGVKSNMKGHKYLVKSISLIVEDWERASNIWAIYNKLADEYGTTPKAVEKAIRYVLKSSNNKSIVNCPPSEFICRVADKVRFSS